MRFLLEGWYGRGNTGDDALAACVSSGLVRYAKAKSVFVRLYKPLVLPPFPEISCPGNQHKWFRGQHRITSFIKRFRADYFLFGGGSLFSDVWGGTGFLRDKLDLVEGYRRWGKRVAAIGVSVGPLLTAEGYGIARRIMEQLDSISVRDFESSEILNSMGVKHLLAFDPVVTLEDCGLTSPPSKDYPAIQVNSGARIGVSLCTCRQYAGHDRRHDVARQDAIAESLAAVHKRLGCTVLLFEFSCCPTWGDRKLLEGVKDRLAGSCETRLVPYDANPLNTLRYLGLCDVVIAMRLHAAVMSFATQVPCLILAYHQKCRGFARMAQYPDGAVFDADRFAPCELSEAVRRLVEGDRTLHPQVGLDEAKQSAVRGFSAIGLVNPGRVCQTPVAESRKV